MDPTKSKSRGTSGDMSPDAIEWRLETLDEMRELALELSQAKRLGPVRSKKATAEEPSSLEVPSTKGALDGPHTYQ